MKTAKPGPGSGKPEIHGLASMISFGDLVLAFDARMLEDLLEVARQDSYQEYAAKDPTKLSEHVLPLIQFAIYLQEFHSQLRDLIEMMERDK